MLLYNPNSSSPEQHITLAAHKLAEYNISIAALSKTHFADEGQLTEVEKSYTFF